MYLISLEYGVLFFSRTLFCFKISHPLVLVPCHINKLLCCILPCSNQLLSFCSKSCFSSLVIFHSTVPGQDCSSTWPLLNNFYLFILSQGLAIIAFNDGNITSKTIREVLSVGPTYFVMKFFESNK